MSHQSNTRTKRERVEYLNPQRGTDRPLCGDGRLHHRAGSESHRAVVAQPAKKTRHVADIIRRRCIGILEFLNFMGPNRVDAFGSMQFWVRKVFQSA
jgi:hypothetical protein